MPRPQAEPIDIRESGGQGAKSDRRLFMQLLSWTGCRDTAALVGALEASGLDAVLYEDVNDPLGVALVTATQDPGVFSTTLRELLGRGPFAELTPRPAHTMLGRTYAIGYEPDLDETLIKRPRRHLFENDWPWAIWYPLRRKGGFTQLPDDEQRDILMEHGKIGMAFGSSGLAHDIRLACHGLDQADNDFVIALLGPDLAPLSKVVEAMRKTKQTANWLERLGPFFVGHKAWQSGSSGK